MHRLRPVAASTLLAALVAGVVLPGDAATSAENASPMLPAVPRLTGGVALTDMRVWRWMYARPDATPAELRDATLGIAREVWNRFSMLYLPDCPVGAMIARQVEQQIARSGISAQSSSA